MTRTALRVMAFLCGIHDERPARSRIASAVRRSERSVERAMSKLVKIGWLVCPGGGCGTPSKITVLNRIDWILAGDSKMAGDCEKVACDSKKVAGDWRGIRVKEELHPKATTEAASFPLTLAAIQERFPMDRAGVQRLVAVCPGVTDAELAEAVCIATKTYQESAGLYLHTIPPLLEFWRARRKPPARETCGLCLGTGSVHDGPRPAWELPDSDPAWAAWDATERACGCQNKLRRIQGL